jgi:hypothetical protein
MKPLRYNKEFSDDLASAVEWYSAISAKVCNDLQQAAGQALSSIENYPESFAFIGRGRRRAVLRGFPWMIIFREEENAVRIFRLVHSASNWESES